MLPRIFLHAMLAGVVAVAFVGCSPAHPGMWDLPKVESHIAQKMELSEIKLEPAGTSAYTGTGKTAEGESFKIQVTQDVANKSLRWKYEGDRGTIGDEKYEFVQ